MLYFIRHGQTDANLKRINAGGEYDIPLNATGMEQARLFSQGNQDLIASFDTIFVSPMIRAQQTADLILTGHQKPMIVIENLREWMLGDWSGTSYDTTQDLFTGDHAPPGGETKTAFYTRAIRALQDAGKRDVGKALIVAHGGIWFSYAHYTSHPVSHLENCSHQEICRVRLGKISPVEAVE
jgi:broad specificity phosphatase PhoE